MQKCPEKRGATAGPVDGYGACWQETGFGTGCSASPNRQVS
ncbi:unnamed protein product [Tuwongella immobilis]|uniref:Uncharacterized protein n=1 Tax=Tuwongella immobilis TaxID=692036 RepID=A0A6C2YIE6_9BACT|nr:unnamed protein product [Tuwongella immobilis]VTR97244.1 unnamed protein product [Tuwongella immobilis]